VLRDAGTIPSRQVSPPVNSRPPHAPTRARWIGACIPAILLLLVLAPSAMAETGAGWAKWWLPPVRSVHGAAMDSLFYWIFWITMITFIAVELILVFFLVKYRDRKGKAHFTHGNTRLEMAWTIAPAILLAAIALGSKGVWDRYRYSDTSTDPHRAKLLVIGEQFKWNFVYPGPDGKFGRYLLFPHPSDARWPAGREGNVVDYAGVAGPAALPYKQAIDAINKYIAAENPLGKDFTDPDGKDDNFTKEPGRELILPVNRPIEVQVTSKDVIHDFFLPNFRVKLDAVPGMLGHVYFTANMTSEERNAEKAYNISIDKLKEMLTGSSWKSVNLIIDEKSPGTEENKNRDSRGWRYRDPAVSATASIIRSGTFNPNLETRLEQVDRLKAAGLTEVRITTESWELVCEELCGAGHNTMIAPLVIVSPEAYDKLEFDAPGAAPPSTAPTVASAAR
jgi:heme/copper-type cytochrome/quinol oxidase subunit 2